MTTPSTGSAMAQILAIIEGDLTRIANAYDPVGMEDVIEEYRQWPTVLNALAGVWKVMQAKAEADYPLKAAAADLVGAISAHQRTVADAAEAIPGVIRSLHAEQLDNLTDQRNAMWDLRANPNTAARP